MIRIFHNKNWQTQTQMLSLQQFPTQKPEGPNPTKPLWQVPYVNAFGVWTYIEMS